MKPRVSYEVINVVRRCGVSVIGQESCKKV